MRHHILHVDGDVSPSWSVTVLEFCCKQSKQCSHFKESHDIGLCASTSLESIVNHGERGFGIIMNAGAHEKGACSVVTCVP